MSLSLCVFRKCKVVTQQRVSSMGPPPLLSVLSLSNTRRRTLGGQAAQPPPAGACCTLSPTGSRLSASDATPTKHSLLACMALAQTAKELAQQPHHVGEACCGQSKGAALQA